MRQLTTVAVLVAGVVGGLLLVLAVMVIFKYCVRRTRVIKRLVINLFSSRQARYTKCCESCTCQCDNNYFLITWRWRHKGQALEISAKSFVRSARCNSVHKGKLYPRCALSLSAFENSVTPMSLFVIFCPFFTWDLLLLFSSLLTYVLAFSLTSAFYPL